MKAGRSNRSTILSMPGLRPGRALRRAALLSALLPGLAPAEEGVRLRFIDVAREAGLGDFKVHSGRPGKDHLLDSAGTGAAFLDYDRDGRLDAYLVNGWRLEGSKVIERGRHALFHGRGDGSFEDVTSRSGTGGAGHWGSGVAAADADGDGWTDILVTHFGPTALFRNRGDGTFEDVAPRMGLAEPGWFTGAAFFDAEGDGDLDLYIASYIDCSLEDVLEAKRTLDWKGLDRVAAGPFGMKGGRDRFYRAESGKFVDATAASGFEDRALAFGFGVRAGDFDDDGDADVFVANDSDPDYYYRNEGKGAFREAGILAGCALDGNGSAQASMGVAAGDLTGDGILDIFVTTFAEDSSTFFRGSGGGLFEDATARLGLREPTYLPLSWGTAMADLDNDGDLDLVALNGHIYPQVDAHPERSQTYAQRNQVFENRENVLVEVTAGAGPGFESLRSSRGLAVGDVDNDGDLDLLMTSLDSPPALLRNETPSGSWLTVVIEDASGPMVRIGTRVTVTAGGRRIVHDVAAGDSYLSTHDPRLHFGLGAAEKADRVEVRWPDGSRTALEDVPARRFLKVRQEH